MQNPTLIELKHLEKIYEGKVVVDNFNLKINRGEFVTLLGPSGCGKTTTLRMIGGFVVPSNGTVSINGENITNMPPYKRPVNTVFQKYALFPHLNVFKNVAYGLKLKKVQDGTKTTRSGKVVEKTRKFSKAEIKEKVNAMLTLVNLEDYGSRGVATLSGGQQQRVAIARALVNEPEVLLLDEPLGALDLKMRKEMQFELMSMQKRLGITFVYVTHDQEEALTMSDRVVVMKDGEIQQVGTPKQIYDEPANAFVADFIGESNILTGVMLKDFVVEFCAHQFKCEDKGFEKNEKVDLVIRPEDIKIYDINATKGQLTGSVTSLVFKGTYYEMNVLCGDYEFTVQSTSSSEVGDLVKLHIAPNGIHIMKKTRTTNEYITHVDGVDTFNFHGASVEFNNHQHFSKGDKIKVSIGFDQIELLDDERAGMIGGNIGASLYKGAYYQVQVYTDDYNYMLLNTDIEWDLRDRVGIKINTDLITVEQYVDTDDETDNNDSYETADTVSTSDNNASEGCDE